MKISWVNVYYDKLGVVLANLYVTSFISSTLFRTLESVGELIIMKHGMRI